MAIVIGLGVAAAGLGFIWAVQSVVPVAIGEPLALGIRPLDALHQAAELFARQKSPYTRALFAAAFNLEAAGEDAVAQ